MTATVALTATGFSAARLKLRAGDLVTVRLDPGRAVVQSDRLGRPLPWVEGDATGPLPHLLGGLRVLDEGEPAALAALPGVDCTYCRLDWSEVEPERGRYDWSRLDAFADAAVKAGRYYATGIRAGVSGTPRWVLASVPTVRLQGIAVPLPLVQSVPYRDRYAAVQRALAEHLRGNAAQWRALASVTVSGCNWHTLEARLPNREAGEDGPGVPSEPDAIAWARAGHTPEGVRAFYSERFAEHARLFPGKDATFPLIQGGFPAVREADGGRPVSSVAQLLAILADGRAALGDRLVVQHLGLADRPPNPYVLQAARDGSPIAWQTTNDLGPEGFDRALRRALATPAEWVEVYPRNVPPEGLAAWAGLLRRRPAVLEHSWRVPAGASWVADASDPRRVLSVVAE